MPAMWLAAQFTSSSTSGMNDMALSVSEYSTRGGTSAYTLRATKPSRSSERRVDVSTFWEMSGMLLCKALKRMLPLLRIV